MKKRITILSLLFLSSGLIADDCCCCYCEPEPTECVDGVAYTVPAYDLQCDWGVSLDLEFLYWYARETDLSYAMTFTSKERSSTNETTVFAPSRYKDLGTKWDPGFRAGLGWNSACDGWDLSATYTWFHNRKTSSTSVPEFLVVPEVGEQGILNPWINQSFHQRNSQNQQVSNQNIQLFSKVAAKWRLQLNIIDLELGRKYWLSECFNLRPYAGVRGAWWKTRFRTTSTKETDPTRSQSFTYDFKFVDRFTNRVWGVGILGGLQPAWYFSCCFAIYGNIDVALLWGDIEGKKRERYTQPEARGVVDGSIDYSNRSNRKFSQMTPALDAGIGFRWEEIWCCDRFRTALDLGWEHHVYFDVNHRMKSVDTYVSGTAPVNTGFRSYFSQSGNLGLGGFVMRFKWDF